jgi:hypothetical protein
VATVALAVGRRRRRRKRLLGITLFTERESLEWSPPPPSRDALVPSFVRSSLFSFCYFFFFFFFFAPKEEEEKTRRRGKVSALATFPPSLVITVS